MLRRIESGRLTRTALAQQSGFKQAHISNFLNKKRTLSMEGLDRVLSAQAMTVAELMPLDLSAAADSDALADGMVAIPVVSATTAMEEPGMRAGLVIETVPVSAARLEELRPRGPVREAEWQRFVAVRADAQQAAAMDPLIAEGAVVVLDRHYTSLAPYRGQQQKALYAVRAGAGLALRYVEFEDGRLILRPLAASFPVQLVAPGEQETPADYIVGRVCLLVSEL